MIPVGLSIEAEKISTLLFFNLSQSTLSQINGLFSDVYFQSKKFRIS